MSFVKPRFAFLLHPIGLYGLSRGYRDYSRIFLGYIGIMAKKMETAISGLGFRVQGGMFWVAGLVFRAYFSVFRASACDLRADCSGFRVYCSGTRAYFSGLRDN